MARIGFDCDGVLYPFTEQWGIHAAKMLGVTQLSLLNWTAWDSHVEHMGLTHEQFDDIRRDAVLNGNLFRFGFPPMDASKSMWELMDAGHTIVIATDRNIPGAEKESQRRTRQWLLDKMIPFDEIKFTADKREAECDMFLDDRPNTIPTLRMDGVDAWYFDQPWNAKFPFPRVHSIREYVDIALEKFAS